jgi:TPR repeat protein
LSVRSLALCFALVVNIALAAPAQGPPLNGTPEQLFDAGMNALSGSAGTRNDLAAVDYFRRSAQKGYGPAQVVLGYLYDTGQIVVRDTSQATDWYRKAADAGDPLAQWLLGRLYVAGAGLPQDYAAAQKWLTLSANQKNPFAAYLLGGILSERDFTKAPHWFQVAAEQGLPQAQYAYAWTLKEGRGIEQDRVRAYTWFLLAMEGGYPAAQNDLGLLEGVLSRDQIDQAKTDARRLEESASRSVAAHGCTGWDGEFSEMPAPPPPKIPKFCR